MKRSFSTFLGVDLGGGKGKTTAVARLSLAPQSAAGVSPEGSPAVSPSVSPSVSVEEVLTRDPESGAPFYDRELVAYLERHSDGAVLAIDAPLTLTACVRCTVAECPGIADCVDPTVVWFRNVGDQLLQNGNNPERASDEIAPVTVSSAGKRAGKPISTPYTQRATEAWLFGHTKILPRETLGQGMGPITARARHLVRALGRTFRLNENLLEVFPKATVERLFSKTVARGYKRGAPAYDTRQKILHDIPELTFGPRTGFQRERCFSSDHGFDALLCAYTAFLWARDGWEQPQEHREVWAADGWIWHP